MECLRGSCAFLRRSRVFIMAIAFPLLLLPVLLWHPDLDANVLKKNKIKLDNYFPQYGAYVLLLMACYWVTECLPLPVTSLLPLVLFPLFGISNPDALASKYLSQVIIFLLGGCILALAFEYSKLNVRIALKVVSIVGAKIPAILFGIMGVATVLSMFMSNTSTTTMIIPIANAIVAEFAKAHTRKPKTKDGEQPQVTENDSQIKQDGGTSNDKPALDPEAVKTIHNLKCLFLISIAFAANIGGTGLQTGSSTNLIAVAQLDGHYKELENSKLKDKQQCRKDLEVSFTSWAGLAALPMIINILIVWAYLQIHFLGLPSWMKFWRKRTDEEIESHEVEKVAAGNVNREIKRQYAELGPLTFHEIFILVIFTATISLWVFRHPIFIKGWGDTPIFPKDNYILDSTPTLFMCFFLFIFPRKSIYYKNFMRGGLREGVRDPVLTWDVVEQKIPWGPFLLLGGGSAVALGAQQCGLNAAVGDFLAKNSFIASLDRSIILLVAIIIVAIVTSVASNDATILILAPVLVALAVEKRIHPIYLVVVPTISGSYAFMFPVSTPPNAIAFDAGGLKQMDLFGPGLPLTIITNAVLYFCVIFILDPAFGLSLYDGSCDITSVRSSEGRSVGSMIMNLNKNPYL